MWLKPTILVVLIALILSLASGFFFLMKDRGSTKRTLWSLGVRVALAVILVGLISYGLYSGQLGNQAPWGAAGQPTAPPGSENVDEQE
jgi:hypothetical protein